MHAYRKDTVVAVGLGGKCPTARGDRIVEREIPRRRQADIAAGDDFAIRLQDDRPGDVGCVTGEIGSVDYAYDLLLQPDGKIIAVGSSSYRFALARYNADGSVDTSFGVGGKVTVDLGAAQEFARDLVIQADGKIVVAGDFVPLGGNGDFAIVRFNPDGSLDTGFGDLGIMTTDFGFSSERAAALTLQADGKLVVVGGADNRFAIARYDADGSLDTTFDDDGTVTTWIASGGSAQDVHIDDDGRIVILGYAYGTTTGADFVLARYNRDGSLDTTFDEDGIVITDFSLLPDLATNDRGTALAVQPDGKIVAVGYSDGDIAMARHVVHPSLIVVNTNNGGEGSLRQVILDANVHLNLDGPDRILFDIPADDPGHVYYRDDGVPGHVSVANIATTTRTGST
ncbi:MAG: hypothetical protein HQ581_04160 [Planctomycetes bacterium]|nr:hypothetical protein [Planctomycetota bacterium]